MFRYRITRPWEYLAITGHGIKDIKIAKKAWIIWPLHKCTFLDVSPENYTFEVLCRSADNFDFRVMPVFSIGPAWVDKGALVIYARLISKHRNYSGHIGELLKAVTEGVTCVVASTMRMDDIMTNQFRDKVLHLLQLQLNNYGLLIYTAHIRKPFSAVLSHLIINPGQDKA